MTLLMLAPAILSLLILGAHLVRSGLALVALLVPFLLCVLFVPRGWVARFFQTVLLLGALEWLRAAFFLAVERQEAGLPWLRATSILAGAALLCIVAALLFETRPLRRLYPRSAPLLR